MSLEDISAHTNSDNERHIVNLAFNLQWMLRDSLFHEPLAQPDFQLPLEKLCHAFGRKGTAHDLQAGKMECC